MILNLTELTMLTAQHALQLRQLIGAADAPVIAETGCQVFMLAALRAAVIDILTTIHLVPIQERLTRPVCGFWTLHELVGHLADWDRYFLYWLGLLCENRPNEIYWDENGDAFNEGLRLYRQGEPWEDSWNDFRSNRSALYAQFSEVSSKEFMRLQPPNVHVSYPTIYHCAWSALEHYLDHAAGVRRALDLPLPEEPLDFHGPYT